MVRKMTYVGFSYMIGLFFASFFSFLNLIIFSVATFCCILVYNIIKCKSKAKIITCFVTFIVAIIIYNGYTYIVYDNAIKYDDKNITFCGKMYESKKISDDRQLAYLKGKINGGKEVKISAVLSVEQLDFNDEITITGKAVVPDDTIEFATKKYLKSKGIYLQIDEPEIKSIKYNNSFSIKNKLDDYRNYITGRFNTVLPSEEGKIITAMVTGNTRSVDKKVLENLYDCGIGHLMAVSGEHLMIVCGLLLLLLRKLKLNNVSQFIITELAVLLFCIFTGMRMSVIRSAIMFTILMLSLVVKRKTDILTSIAIAGFIITLFSPYAIMDSSFLLSIAGTFAVTVFAPYVCKEIKLNGKFKKIRYCFVTMICVSVCLIPVTALFFDKISIISPVTNVLLVPLASVCIVCGMIVVLTGGISIFAYPLLMIGGLVAKFTIFCSHLLGRLPFETISVGNTAFKISLLCCFVIVGVICLIFRTKKAFLSALLSCTLALICVTQIYSYFDSNNYKIAVIIKNSKVAVVCIHKSSVCVMDLSDKSNMSYCVNKYLSSEGYKNISMLYLDGNCQYNISEYISDCYGKIDNVIVRNNQMINTDKAKIKCMESMKAVTTGNMKFTINEDGLCTVNINKFNLICYSDNDIINNSKQADIVLKYGKDISLISDNKKKIIFDKRNKSGYICLIEINKSGKYKVRRICNAINE